jgi:hypothetical protein
VQGVEETGERKGNRNMRDSERILIYGPAILAISEETLMIRPSLLFDSNGRKCFDVKNGPFTSSAFFFLVPKSSLSIFINLFKDTRFVKAGLRLRKEEVREIVKGA